MIGARDAFDVDHIAAIDNFTHKLRREGKRSVAVGFFFALRRSIVVILMFVRVVLGARGFMGDSSELSQNGGILNTSASFRS